ncbi:F5/8 type C domain protein [Pseudobythopirellula maris]|uniref:F5/8 type C domain protein n=1 Tax=Pseudobythopirellula maris TaxID=2527991 RepID=A0A5C5ZTB6_9BACT|nr:glycosyl hydrolase [Pseudobythopirellula maris]TWT90268.1 F5/8 type C domain protein [Pseudobythopirellula maris]
MTKTLFLLALFMPIAASEGVEFRDPLRAELAASAEPSVELKAGWRDPPQMARTRCWWWWLNGNVTKEGITRDLEELKSKGIGGANIIDAGGANQRGHRQVPHGPDFGSPEWLGLFQHALREADRLGLELGLNIQSGWNLGGPTVTAEQAAKKLTWSELLVSGGQRLELDLPQPETIGDYYQDVAVLALPVAGERGAVAVEVTASSAQGAHPPLMAIDGDPSTFWVSGTHERGEGPNPSKPQRLEFEFSRPTALSRIVVTPRPGYGPRRGWLQVSKGPLSWSVIARWDAKLPDEPFTIDFDRTEAKRFRLVIVDAFDPFSPAAPRNAQVAEVKLFDRDEAIGGGANMARVDRFEEKAYYSYPGGFTAAKAEHLLDFDASHADEPTLKLGDAIDLTGRVDAHGRLTWPSPPPGVWKLLRIGCTLSGSRVSTSSEGWSGWAIDYLDPGAFERYWEDVVEPILAAAGPSIGRSLRYLHTDSWELGPVNWTPGLPERFRQLRGYDMEPYLPVLAGYVVGSPEVSNRFLNDFRRTLADMIADGKYATFRDSAHARGLAIHPESGGPHAAPIDALKCMGRSDIMMGEFWARSATHRVNDYERLFTKQPASAAHTYGRRVVMAEAFTSIGPQWERDPAMLKPVFDRVACEGLNLVMLHTFDSSPPEMGLPGQAYFAGTHINPNVTWWDLSDGFFSYLNRCQFMLQQGLPVSDVLYYYGENVPSFVRLKNDNPAGAPPGYDYDVLNTEVLIGRIEVRNGKLALPEGTSYELLVLPPGPSYGLEALRRVAELVEQGARVIGPRPPGPFGLLTNDERREFDRLVTRLWGAGGATGPIIDAPTDDALAAAAIEADFAYNGQGQAAAPLLDYIHRTTDEAEIYFVVNRTEEEIETECSFRVAGPRPELWDPVTGGTPEASSYQIDAVSTRLPIVLPANGSVFVIFRGADAERSRRDEGPNLPRPAPLEELDLRWSVRFDPALGGPAQPIEMDRLTDWSEHDDPAIKHYSGKAVYRCEWSLDDSALKRLDGGRVWLDLGSVQNLARVRVNGVGLGVAWTPPYRVEMTGVLQEHNVIEVEVANLWPNRLIGDLAAPPDKRITRTNVVKFRADSPLLPSGLLGPVRVLTEAAAH